MATTGNETPETTQQRGSAPPLGDPFSRNALNLPNLITVSRLLLSLVLFILIWVEGFPITSAIVFVVAASTDALDGYIARRYGAVTTLGRILDPFVDKIIICGAFVFLLAKQGSGVNAWMVIIVISREMFITSLRGFLEQHGRDFSATASGKIKMVVQCVAVSASLLSLSPYIVEAFPVIIPFRDVLLWSAVAVTAYSGIIYVQRAVTMLRGESGN